MSAQNAAIFDGLRSIVAASITGSYVQLGSSLPYPAVVVTFKNLTNGIIYVSTDGITDMLVYTPNTYGVYDIRTNAPNLTDFLIPVYSSFYIKYSGSAPTTGSFYIEAILSKNNT